MILIPVVSNIRYCSPLLKKPLKKPLLKKLITYICGFDPCREQHQVVTNSLYKSKTLFESTTLYQSENLKCLLPNLQVLKRLFNYHCSKFRIEACLIRTTASEGATGCSVKVCRKRLRSPYTIN